MTTSQTSPIAPFSIMTAESEEGFSEPVGCIGSIEESLEIAESDFKARSPENDLCPYEYVIWSRNDRGKFTRVATIHI